MTTTHDMPDSASVKLGASLSNSNNVQPPALTVVGIGASAGGVKALCNFFAALPAEHGLTFVVVVNLPPEDEVFVLDRLKHASAMPVELVMGRVQMLPEQVYLIPADKRPVVRNGQLETEVIEPLLVGQRRIDHLFRALAEVYEDGAAILLSGTGSDGALGIRAIKERGGLVLVQSPDEAEYDSMPSSAIATGIVDFVGRAADLAKEVVAAKRIRASIYLPAHERALSREERDLFAKLLAFVPARTQEDIALYKPSVLFRHLAQRLQVTHQHNISDYLEHMRKHEQEAERFARSLHIKDSGFFRELDTPGILAQTILPNIFRNKQKEESVRVWCMGCSTGEDVYSLAILLIEEAERADHVGELRIFASCSNKAMIDYARKGRYPEAIAADLSDGRLARFFAKEDARYLVRIELRERVLFTVHNLVQDPPFSKLDIISCRHLLNTLQPDVQTQLMRAFHFALQPNGYLSLDKSHSTPHPDQFLPFNASEGVYRPSLRPGRAHLLHSSEYGLQSVASFLPELETAELFNVSQEQPQISRKEYSLLLQELLTSNEALQFRNDDYSGALAELQSRKEELQSVNEELQTYAEDLRSKIDELNQAHNDLQNFFFATHIATLFLDRQLRIQRYTPGAADLFHLIPQDRMRPISHLSSEVKYPQLEADADHVAAHLVMVTREVEAYDGRWFRVEVRPYRTLHDEIGGIVITFVDVTSNKRIEQALQVSEERLRRTMESIADHAIITLDTAGQIVDWNVGAMQMFGYSADEVIGQPSAILFTPEDRANDLPIREIEQARSHGRAADERWQLRKDGSRFYASGVLAPLQDDGILGYVKVARDLTARKRAEEELRLLNETLELRVQDRTAQVRQLVTQLTMSEQEERRRISAILHDDLQQRLFSLNFQLVTLRSMLQDGESQNAQQMIGEIEHDLYDAVQVTRNLSVDLSPPVLHNEGLFEAIRWLAVQMEQQHGLTVKVHAEGEWPRMNEDLRVLLFQLVRELLFNVVKHAGVATAEVALAPDVEKLRIVVSDLGKGFESEAKGPQNSQGLARIQQRLLLFGGYLQIDSRPGEGTRAILYIPLNTAKGE